MNKKRKNYYAEQQAEMLKVLNAAQVDFESQTPYKNVFQFMQNTYGYTKEYFAKLAQKNGWDVIFKNGKYYIGI